MIRLSLTLIVVTPSLVTSKTCIVLRFIAQICIEFLEPPPANSSSSNEKVVTPFIEGKELTGRGVKEGIA